ncbi:hypothetical protein PR048_005174 [Dryococelus australis]|uniref:Uncharacterized protein n=1 Tax=Dryococelus australis TaxID=614101 RepID=A0ABQ9I7F9_9NEOP|nr:hypothetical protein PR048_005174 [Dryococelus australis]
MNEIITEKCYTERITDEKEVKKIITIAADNLIQQEILSRPYECDFNPIVEEIKTGNTKLVGELLNLVRLLLHFRLDYLFHLCKLAWASTYTGDLDKKNLIDLLLNLGICSSYHEVVRYESSVTTHGQATVDGHAYVLFVYDNADYYHMYKHLHQLLKQKILFLGKPTKLGYSNIVMQDVMEIPLKPKSTETAHWAGFIERVLVNDKFETSAIMSLAFINMDPGNPFTIYTSLLQASEESVKCVQSKVMVTYYQPLSAKATEIVSEAAPESPLKYVIVHLGGFHLLLLYMGSVGKWNRKPMADSICQEQCCTLSGRAYSRAFRAHLLTFQALATLILEETAVDVSFVETSFDLKKTSNGEKINAETNSGRTAKLWVQYMNMVNIMCSFIRSEHCGDLELHFFAIQQMLP